MGTHISESALQTIRKKKTAIKSKQVAAEKRRELAKKAVAARDDEEMFQALFENVHEDVRSQQRSLDKAKEAIQSLQQDGKDLQEEFQRERTELLEAMRQQSREI